MLRAIVLALLSAASVSAHSFACGIPPLPPIGMKPVCVCNDASNCYWIFVSK